MEKEKRYDDMIGQFLTETARGEDWVAYIADGGFQSTMTRYQWDKMPTEPENILPDGEWPYAQ